jgi:hypothetical protein
MRKRRPIREEWGSPQIDRHRSTEVGRPVGQVCHHGGDELFSISKLKSPVGSCFLADGGERRGRNLSPAQRSGTVRRIHFNLVREFQQLIE